MLGPQRCKYHLPRRLHPSILTNILLRHLQRSPRTHSPASKPPCVTAQMASRAVFRPPVLPVSPPVTVIMSRRPCITRRRRSHVPRPLSVLFHLSWSYASDVARMKRWAGQQTAPGSSKNVTGMARTAWSTCAPSKNPSSPYPPLPKQSPSS